MKTSDMIRRLVSDYPPMEIKVSSSPKRQWAHLSASRYTSFGGTFPGDTTSLVGIILPTVYGAKWVQVTIANSEGSDLYVVQATPTKSPRFISRVIIRLPFVLKLAPRHWPLKGRFISDPPLKSLRCKVLVWTYGCIDD